MATNFGTTTEVVEGSNETASDKEFVVVDEYCRSLGSETVRKSGITIYVFGEGKAIMEVVETNEVTRMVR